MTLRYGVIGAGVIAPTHLEAIDELDDVELVGISALVEEEVAPLANAAGCPWFVDHRELLALSPDVVVVCTPHPSHPALTIDALEAGAHVLVEKPLAVEVREADEMIAVADRTGRLLGVCFQQRFRPVVAAAHALVADGRLGELIRASIVDPLYRPNAYYRAAAWRGTWDGEGGGVLMNQAPHTLDLLCHLAGPPATVWGKAWRRSQPMETEDTATALLEYPNGAVGTVAVSTTEPGVQRIELVGDRGRIEIVGETIAFERFEPPVSEHLATATGMFDVPRSVDEPVLLPAGRGDHFDVHEDFAAAVRTGSEPRVPARSALCSLEVANAIVLSTYTGEAVTLPVDRSAYTSLLAGLRGYALTVGSRVLVIGMAGAGKSTFARALSARTGLPVIHLDVHYWKPGWVKPSEDEWREKQRSLLDGAAWIADGNDLETLDLRLERADTVVLLDTPWWLCAARAFVRGLRRPVGEMPEGCDDSAVRRLRDEFRLVGIVCRDRRSETERARAIVSQHGRHAALYVLGSKQAAREFLSTLSAD